MGGASPVALATPIRGAFSDGYLELYQNTMQLKVVNGIITTGSDFSSARQKLAL
jgi:hypothetical protein